MELRHCPYVSLLGSHCGSCIHPVHVSLFVIFSGFTKHRSITYRYIHNDAMPVINSLVACLQIIWNQRILNNTITAIFSLAVIFVCT